MAIIPYQKSVDELFGTEKYYVDFYQREYKWNDNKQSYKPIKALLDDITYRFNLSYDKNVIVNDNSIANYDWYYLNSFMTNTVGGKTYIVDGQQRLTTLTIILIALYHLGQKPEFNIKAGVLTNLSKKICDYDSNGDIEFWMGFDDRKVGLSNIYNLKPGEFYDRSHSGNSSVSENNIYSAYEVVYKYLDDFLTTEHIYNAFRLYLLKRVFLIKINVDKPEDVAMTFEVINDRGVPLKPHEILKGKILGIIPKVDVEHYVKIWEDAVDNISAKYDDESVDSFFSIYFQSKFADTDANYRELFKDRYQKTIYLEEFNQKIGFKNTSGTTNAITNVKSFVEDTLPYYVGLFIRIMKDSNNSSASMMYSWFNHINGQDTPMYLIFSAVNYNDPDVDAKYELIEKLFDRNYVMLNLTGAYRSNDFNNSIMKLGREIRSADLNKIRKSFDDSLVNDVAKSLARSDIKTIADVFKYELFANAGYSTLGQRFLRYYFARIDHLISEEAKMATGTYYSLISQAKGKDVYHIEHILANDDNKVNMQKFADEEEFVTQRNRLGDLLLLKGNVNQSSGNELFVDKIKTYTGNGTLFAQTLVPGFTHSNVDFKAFCQKRQLTFGVYSDYDKNSIEERHKLLHAMTKIIWNF